MGMVDVFERCVLDIYLSFYFSLHVLTCGLETSIPRLYAAHSFHSRATLI